MLCNASACGCWTHSNPSDARREFACLLGDRREAVTGLNGVSSGSGGHRNRISPTHDSLFIVLQFSIIQPVCQVASLKGCPLTVHHTCGIFATSLMDFVCHGLIGRKSCLTDYSWPVCEGKELRILSGNIKSIHIISFVHHMSKHSSNFGVWIMKKKNILHYKQLYRIICPLKVLDGGCCWVYTLIHWASAELVWGMEERLGLISPLKSRLWEAEKMLRCSNSKQDKSIFVFYTIEESCSEENKVFVSLHSLLGSIVKRFCGQLHKKCYYPVLRLISEWVVVKCCWYDIYFFIIYNV